MVHPGNRVSGIAAALLVLSSSLCWGLSLKVDDVRLSPKSLKSVDEEQVFTTTDKSWPDKVGENCQALIGRISVQPAASIEVETEGMSSWGSVDPFVLKGKERAATRGANVLYPVKITVMKNTDRFVIVTFEADRFTFDGKLIPPEILDTLAAKKWDPDQLAQAMKTNAAPVASSKGAGPF